MRERYTILHIKVEGILFNSQADSYANESKTFQLNLLKYLLYSLHGVPCN